MDKKTPIFVDGLNWKRPNEKTKEKAPWVKGHMSINVPKLMAWMIKHQQGEWLNLDLKESKDKTKLYFELNTYGRTEEKAVEVPVVQLQEENPGPYLDANALLDVMSLAEFNDF